MITKLYFKENQSKKGDNMNDQYFLKTYHFFHIKHLILIITVGLLPSFVAAQMAAEHQNAINPYNASGNDSIIKSASKEIGAMATGIAVNHQMLRLYKGTHLYPVLAAIVFQQTKQHFSSKKKSSEIKRQLTDTRGYNSYRSTGEFSQEDWNEQLEQSAIGLRDLQSHLIDQELEKYIDNANKKAQEDIKYYQTKGYQYDSKNNRLTVPGGKSIATKDILTPKGFKALGLSSKDFKKFEKQRKSFEQKAVRQGKAVIDKIVKSAKLKASRLASKTKSIDLAKQKDKKTKGAIENQNINGYAHNGSTFNSDWQAPSFQDILNQQKKQAGDSESEGELTMLSKRHGNDLIGIADNNIFDMIHRQYLRRRSQMSDASLDSFIAER